MGRYEEDRFGSIIIAEGDSVEQEDFVEVEDYWF